MIYVELTAPLSRDVGGQVPNGDLDVAGHEVEAAHEFRRVRQDQLAAGTPASVARGPGVGVRDEPRSLELRNQGGDRCPGEAGGSRDGRLADLALHPQDLDHALPVTMPQPGERSIPVLRHRRQCASMAYSRSLSRPRTPPSLAQPIP